MDTKPQPDFAFCRPRFGRRVVRASWSGYWAPGDGVDYVRVQRWRVYVEVTTDGCKSCGHGAGVRYETLDAEQVGLV